MENSPIRVKHENPVEFVLIIPRPAIKWHTPKQEEDVKPKLVPAVKLTKFDAKWTSDSALFQTFLTCKHCQLVVKSQAGLTYHLRTCSKLFPEEFECDFCGKRFPKKCAMGQHMLKHSKENLFCCNKCGVGLKRKSGLSRLKKIHIKSIACSTCLKKFATNRSLKLHQMQHKHGIYATAAAESFDCDKCDKTFSSVAYLKVHQKVVHDENEVRCEVCDKIYKNQTYLLRHSLTHSKVECSICNKMVSKQTITRHVRSHGNSFKCDLCAHSTNYKSRLKRHIEQNHLLQPQMSRKNFPSLHSAPTPSNPSTSNLTLAQVVKAPAPATQIATPQPTLALIMEAVKAVIPTIVQGVLKAVIEALPPAQQISIVPSTKEIVDEVLKALPAVLATPTKTDIEVIVKGTFEKLPTITPKQVKDEGVDEVIEYCQEFN